MFKNLIESSSHTKEYKRRGSFLLFTGAVYIVLFVVTGVVSIYAYDAHLEAQTFDYVVTLLPPQEIAAEPNRPPAVQPDRARATNTNESTIPERAVAMLDTDRPEVVPDTVSATRSPHLPLPPGQVRITGQDVAGSISGPATTSPGHSRVVQPTQIVKIGEPPPAPPDPPKPPKVVSKGVITSQALSLPKPMYPETAKRMRIQGTVSVQVLIDEHGRVISAKAVSGSPFLLIEAQKAAMQARFSPTKLGDQPVKVSGVITYNFVLGN
ncbi:MAG: energy transducer TonB [Acidobacteria bacterium]|nr:energy transducer TonB [Acidobacteriota bacterium]